MKDDRLISLNVALDVLHGYFDGMLETDTVCPKDLYNEIEALPSAQLDFDAYCDRLWKNAYERGKRDAQPGWIPWDSGRFPEESGTYTVTAYDGATKRVTYAKYQKRLKRWELTGARAYWRVLAWQPMPKPWKGEQP